MDVTVSTTLYGENEACRSIFSIRNVVFVLEQEVDKQEEFDDFEKTSIHYLGILNGIPTGTARWRITDKGIKLERFAVLKEYRKQGVAAAILKRVLNDTVPSRVRIYLHAQVTAVGFYEKYGFVKEGTLFSEAGIDHYVMVFSPTSGSPVSGW